MLPTFDLVGLDKLEIFKIRQDGQTQFRTDFDQFWVEELKVSIGNGDSLPPVVVFRDAKGINWLADGFHRIAAYESLLYSNILCEVYRGELRDAKLFALGCNTKHGKTMKNADKRRAVEILLKDSEWAQWSNLTIAKIAGVSDRTVGNYRVRLEDREGIAQPQKTLRTSPKGNIYLSNLAKKEESLPITKSALIDDLSTSAIAFLGGNPLSVISESDCPQSWDSDAVFYSPSRNDCDALTAKFKSEFVHEKFDEAIAIVTNDNSKKWFWDVVSVSSADCLVRDHGNKVAFYLGHRLEEFTKQFTQFGLVRSL
jgi:ParB-like nuclease domain